MIGSQSSSIQEIAAQLRSWLTQPGEGLALVEFGSEPARRKAIEDLRERHLVVECGFDGGSKVESTVREAVDRLRCHEPSALSVSGLESAFPNIPDREKAIDLLNFLRETIASSARRQIWWVTAETARVLQDRAPDLLSWFTLHLKLADLPGESSWQAMELCPSEPAIGIGQARTAVADARERIERGREGGQQPETLWTSLAAPALRDLERTGAVAEWEHAREEFVDLVYGVSRDAARMGQIKNDLLVMLDRGQYQQAAALASSGNDLRIEGISADRKAEALTILGWAHLRAGRYSLAEDLFREAVKASEQSADHGVSIRSRNGLGMLLHAEGHDQEAALVCLGALQEAEANLGSSSPLTLALMNNLATAYLGTGEYSRAEQLLARAAQLSTQTLGEDHSRTLTTLNSLATVLGMQGRFDEARAMLSRVLDLSEKQAGSEHPETLTALHNLASLYQREGKVDVSLPMMLRALDARDRVLGSDHPDTLATKHALASLYLELDRIGEAGTLLESVREARRRVLGRDHPDTLTSLHNLASVRIRQGRMIEAAVLLELAVEGFRASLGPAHPRTKKAEASLQGLTAYSAVNVAAEAR